MEPWELNDEERKARFGVFKWDKKLQKSVKIADKPKTEGKYSMPLQEYLNRSRHLTKGSWKRPVDPKHMRPDSTAGEDYGTAGCKKGRGVWHPIIDGRCRYCKLTSEEIKKVQKEADDEKNNATS